MINRPDGHGGGLNCPTQGGFVAWGIGMMAAGLVALAGVLLMPGMALAASQVGTKTTVVAKDSAAVLEGYAKLVHAGYQDVMFKAKEMDKAIGQFLDNPSEARLAKAKAAWLAARQIYGQTEVFRFYGGPIDDTDGPEGHMNGWPMDESFVDYVQGAPNAGLIQDAKFDITREALLGMNERGGEENIATGWHAIEFLLWGQDLSEDSAGKRPYTDYLTGSNATSSALRRGQYLRLISGLMVEHLQYLTNAWAPSVDGNYRSQFVRGGVDSLRKILIGMGSLSRGETAGERLEVALFSMDQEDEQSCFSDNTHNDIVANAQGIQNVWLGQYKRPDGSVLEVPALRDLVAEQHADQALETTRAIAHTLAMAQTIQPPFDREIAGGKDGKGRDRLEATVAGLIAQSESIVDAANAIGLTQLTLVHP